MLINLIKALTGMYNQTVSKPETGEVLYQYLEAGGSLTMLKKINDAAKRRTTC